MIQIKDNFLPIEVFKELQHYTLNTNFETLRLGDKDFTVLPVPDHIKSFLNEDGYDLIISFIRKANKSTDTDLRIHSDNIIQGEKTALAKVLYINPKSNASENGTAFWEHHTHGVELPKDVTNEEFDRLITEDSNDLSKWTFRSVYYSEPNKLLTYSSNLFHSKYPAKITHGERIVLVAFYKNK
ncbi:hypothetical protein AS361_03795 [Myroides marinus]|uniref:hypothetical protein n=1 Tax=Myroides marinus TaxID=703342 RepID=UPI0007421613|nr:hypothetical protein [Myroides marinus]KUF38980.1 hypothetical protein AS361_03795 [Myroides marinus]